MSSMNAFLSNALGPDAVQLTAEEKQHLLSRLFSRLAHEIRNPLSSIAIHVQLLEEDINQRAPELKERTAAHFEILHGELHRLDNLVNHFLRLAGPSPLELESIRLDEVVSRVCDLMRPDAAARGIELSFESESPIEVPADRDQLTQALLNLLVNALQAIPGAGAIEVRVGRPGDGWVSIEVADTGPGVPEEARRVIFEPYFTTKPEGSGLGLWIVQQIAMAHGGSVRVTDHPKGGALFILHVPGNRKASVSPRE
jgi:two-component system sensor histidine kinase HydH